MNEEFAKGIPIKLSQLSRVPSTFAGHYDLAAYLVLMIPILTIQSFYIAVWILINHIGADFLRRQKDVLSQDSFQMRGIVRIVSAA